MNTAPELVGTSFRSGYRFQRYWDKSMAWAFFFAELGAGLFAVAACYENLTGMVVGLAITLTLKPYFHLAHMGVPSQAWRALLRADRSWVSRGAIAIGALAAFGGLHVLDRAEILPLGAALGSAVRYAAMIVALIVMCYQGFAMSAAPSLSLWASPLLPVSSLLYATTLGTLALSALAGDALEAERGRELLNAAPPLLIVTLVIVAGILWSAQRKSAGGAFSVQLLLRERYAPTFAGLVFGVGLALPCALLAMAGDSVLVRVAALIAALAGYFTFRLLMFRAAVYEPITQNLAMSLGLPRA